MEYSAPFIAYRKVINSCPVAHAMLAKEVGSIILPPEVTILQYVDDILIRGPDEETVGQSMNVVVQHLQELNINIPDSTWQGPSQEVIFLGTWWIGGWKTLPSGTEKEEKKKKEKEEIKEEEISKRRKQKRRKSQYGTEIRKIMKHQLL